MEIVREHEDNYGPNDIAERPLLYVEIDLSERRLTLGDNSSTPSDKVWDFLKELCHRKKTGEIAPANEFKNAVDTLRRKVGVDALKLIIEIQPQGGYKLHTQVSVKGRGQVGLKKTRQNR